MSAVMFLLCLLPVIANAQIAINILAPKDSTGSFLQTGTISESSITDQDMGIFQIDYDSVKYAVGEIDGSTPDQLHISESYIHATYDWPDVKTVINPHNITVTEVETSEVTLNVTTIPNEHSVSMDVDVGLTAKVENKVTCFWKQNDAFVAKIEYNINTITGGTHFQLSSNFGQNVKKQKFTTLESPSAEFVLQPKKQARVVFKGTKVKVLVEVDYLVYLEGIVAASYADRVDGHYYWGHDIGSVLSQLSLSNSRKAKEIITVEFFTADGIVVS